MQTGGIYVRLGAPLMCRDGSDLRRVSRPSGNRCTLGGLLHPDQTCFKLGLTYHSVLPPLSGLLASQPRDVSRLRGVTPRRSRAVHARQMIPHSAANRKDPAVAVG